MLGLKKLAVSDKNIWVDLGMENFSGIDSDTFYHSFVGGSLQMQARMPFVWQNVLVPVEITQQGFPCGFMKPDCMMEG